MNVFWVCRFCGYLGGGSSQNLTIFRGHFYEFLGLFLRSRYRLGVFFFGGGC